jgi:hypothetical protein
MNVYRILWGNVLEMVRWEEYVRIYLMDEGIGMTDGFNWFWILSSCGL